MNKNKAIAIVGSITLALGVVAPVLGWPMLGDLAYLQYSNNAGFLVLALAITSIVMALLNKHKALWFTAVGSGVIVSFTLVSIVNLKLEANARIAMATESNTTKDLADLMAQKSQIGWGFAVLYIGVLLLIAVASLKTANHTMKADEK